MAAIGAAIGLGTAAGNLASSLGAAGIQSATAQSINSKNIDFQNSVINRGVDSYKSVGLPEAMYWSNEKLTQPNTMFHLGGQNYAEGMGVNSNLPVFTTSMQQYNKAGRAGPISSTNRMQPQSSSKSMSKEVVVGASNGSTNMPGQNDRAGLGVGRYSAVPPPNLLYNSVGAQASTSSRNAFTQAGSQSQTRFSQTGGSFTRNAFAQTNVRLGSGFSNLG